MSGMKLETLISVTDKFSKPILDFEKKLNDTLKPIRNVKKAMKGFDRVSGFKMFREGFSDFKKSSTELLFNVRNIGQSFGYIKSAASSVLSIVNKVSLSGDDLAKTAQRLGLTVEELQKYRHVADLAGVSSERFTKSMQKLSISSSEAVNGISSKKKIFDDLGISLLDKEGQLLSNQELLISISKRFSYVGDGALSASEKLYAANAIFGKSGVDLITVLNQGPEAIRSQMEEMEKYGILTEEQAKLSEEYNDSLTRLKRAFDGLTNYVGASLLEPMIQSVQFLTNYIVEHKTDLQSSLQPFIDSIPELTKTFTSALPGILQAFTTITKCVAKFIDFFGIKWPVIGILGAGTIAPLAASIAALAKMMILPIKSGYFLVKFLKTSIPMAVKFAVPALKRFGVALKASLGQISLFFTAFEIWKPTIELIYKNLDMIKSITFDDLTFCVHELSKSFDGLRETLSNIPILGSILKGMGSLASSNVDFSGIGNDPISDAKMEAKNPYSGFSKSGLFQSTISKTVNNNSHSTIDVNFNGFPNDSVSINRRNNKDDSMYGFSMRPAF